MKQALMKKIFSPYVILLLLVIAANWQLVFLYRGLQWDMMNFWLPWRHYVSECYNNGIIPLWDPYTQGGYPVHGDLQGPAYSPEALLINFLFGQNVYVLNYCVVFYLYVSAVGMYKLTKFFATNANVSILAGVVYATSGFNVAHGHYFYLMVNVALIPFILYYFFRILQEGCYADSLKLSVFIFWHVTTGNPSLLIIAGYMMMVISVFFAAQQVLKKNWGRLFSFMRFIGLALIMSLLMSLPVIWNASLIIPLTTRFQGLPLAFAGDESFYYQNFYAFIAPLLTVNSVDISGRDSEIWSCYVGLFLLLLFFMGLWKKRNFIEWSLAFIGLSGLVIALGLQWSVFPFLHAHLPFFNVFRMPNIAILFFIMFVIITAAVYLSKEGQAEKIFQRKYIWYFLASCAIVMVVMIWVAWQNDRTPSLSLSFNSTRIRKWLYEASPLKIVIFHGWLFLIMTSIILIGSFLTKKKRSLIIFICLADAIVNYQLGATTRVFGTETAITMNDFFDRFPKNFPVPGAMAMEKVQNANRDWPGYTLNCGIFLKQPDFHNNTNSFELTRYHDLLADQPKLSKNLFRNSYAFLADSVINEKKYVDSSLTYAKRSIVIGSDDYAKLAVHNYNNEENRFSCSNYLPNWQEYHIENRTPTAFIILQNRGPLWHYTINQKPIEPVWCCNGVFPVFMIPPGNWIINASYELPGFDVVLLFSLVLCTIILLYIISHSNYTISFKWACSITLVCLFSFSLIKFIKGDATATKSAVEKDVKHWVQDTHSPLLVNNSSLELSGTTRFNLGLNEERGRLLSIMDTLHQEEMSLLNYDAFFSPEAEKIIQALYGKEEKRDVLKDKANILAYRKQVRNLQLDTVWKPENPLYEGNPFSQPVVIDSNAMCRYSKNDVLIFSVDMEAERYDFPGLALEIHYKDNRKETQYRYENVSDIFTKGPKSVVAVYTFTDDISEIEKIVCYAWNPSSTKARIHALKLKIAKWRED